MQLALLCATFALMVVGSQAGSSSESCSMVNNKWHCVKNSDPSGNAAYSGSFAQTGGSGGSRSHNHAATGNTDSGGFSEQQSQSGNPGFLPFYPFFPPSYPPSYPPAASYNPPPYYNPGFAPGGFDPFRYVFGPGGFGGPGAFSGARAGAWGRKKK